MASLQPRNKLILFISACVSINHRDTSAPGSRGHLSQSEYTSGPSEPSAGACDRQAGLELPLPPRGSHPLCSSTLGPQSLTSQLLCLQAVQCLLRAEVPEAGPQAEAGPSPPRREGIVWGLHFPRGQPVQAQGEPGGWGPPAASLLCQKVPGAAACPGPRVAGGGRGALPGAPGAWPPLPCLLLALLTPPPPRCLRGVRVGRTRLLFS